ncbi:MAG TPA: protein-disulfide reductase DsbD domain-containing protein [Spirochaetota bacterium]
MKKIGLVLIMVAASFAIHAQTKDPVSLKYEAKKKGAGIYEVVVTATIDKPWNLYSQTSAKGGPLPAALTFKANPSISLSGTPKETGKLKKVFDKNFSTTVSYYTDTVTFVQTVNVKGNVKTTITGTIEYMVCNDTQCLPPVKKTFNLVFQ